MIHPVRILLVLVFVMLPQLSQADSTTIDFEQFSGPCCFTGIQPPLTVGIATFSGGQILNGTSFLPADQSTVYGTAYFCPGCSPTITIDFSQPVANFSALVLNGQVFTVTYTVADDRGGAQTLTLVANFLSGGGTVSLPSTGIKQVSIAGDAAAWDFFIDNVTFTPGCGTNVTRLSQGNPQWAANLYAHSSTLTIQQKGCALTSLSMALNTAGVPQNPGSLNQFMANTDTDYSGLSVNWGPATRDASGGALKFHATNINSVFNLQAATQYLDNAICQSGNPVIVGVNLDAQGTPGHFVLVTGKQGNDYTIADPGFSGRTTLSQYSNQFVTRGFLADPPGDISELDLTVGDVAEILVTDSLGRKIGYDPGVGQVVQQIPNSAYFRDALENDVTGDAPTETIHFIEISQPSQGQYQIQINGIRLGTYSLSTRVFSTAGTSEPEVIFTGIAGPGSSLSFSAQVSTMPGATSNIVPIVTFDSTLADISNSLNLGLIDNRGNANSLSQKIVAAENDTQPARANVLNAFINEVNAQRGKHITDTAAQILLRDANSLLAQ